MFKAKTIMYNQVENIISNFLPGHLIYRPNPTALFKPSLSLGFYYVSVLGHIHFRDFHKKHSYLFSG